MLNKLLAGKSRMILMVGAIVIGVIMLIIGSGISEKTPDAGERSLTKDAMDYADELEGKIEKFLETVNGINSAKVYVTLDGTDESEYAKDGSNDYVLIDGESGESAALVRMVYPKIRGIAVSCTGGDSSTVKERITALLSAALGIPANKIEVIGQS